MGTTSQDGMSRIAWVSGIGAGLQARCLHEKNVTTQMVQTTWGRFKGVPTGGTLGPGWLWWSPCQLQVDDGVIWLITGVKKLGTGILESEFILQCVVVVLG